MMSEHVAERCPRCGSPLEGRNPYLPSYGRYECGSYDREDTATIECYRRQLAQVQAEVECLRWERETLAAAVMAWEEYRNAALGSIAEVEAVAKLSEAHTKALALLDGEENVNNATHFALYHSDLNWWECQADDCQLLWEFEDGNPYEDGMRFCPRCGRRIVREAQQKHS